MYSRTKSASRAFARLLACALCLAVWPIAAQAADKSQQAYWAGFAYTADAAAVQATRSEEHTSELQSQSNLVCRLLLEKKKKKKKEVRSYGDMIQRVAAGN